MIPGAKTNIQILGLPGSGKSVMATNALIRCVRDFGDAVVYFDPKGDAWAPHVFRAHCPDFTPAGSATGETGRS
ncbi:mobB [Klebsiella pneumoniae]|uniref:MobB n=1 Tax=Klebsiella pneumoniae TaxID=573 RepID=A0A2X3KK54_KLEPN|nr:mobB [Klebsiella pneumoniae]